MRAVLVAPLCGVLVGCGLVSGLDDLRVCTTTCDASVLDSSTDGGGSDAATTTDAGDAGPWSVASVSGLALWLNASVGVTANTNMDPSPVSIWADQSGNHNDGTQQISGRQPTLVAPSINGLPAMHFTSNVGTANLTGAQLVIADSKSLQWGTNPYYVALVAKFDNNPADGLVAGLGTLYAKPAGSTSVAMALAANVGGWTGGNLQAGFESTVGPNVSAVPGPYNNGTVHLFTCHRAAGSLTSSVDGKQTSAQLSGSPTDVSAIGNNPVIGSFGDAANARLDGDIAELIAVENPLDTDIANIEAYLKKRYATP